MRDRSIRKLNCWEFHNCGREKGGLMTDRLGECPVSTTMNFDGANDGVAGGRICWKVPKTQNRLATSVLCSGSKCQFCEFYRRVQHEKKTATKRRIKSPIAG
jgi:hypothetical protein